MLYELDVLEARRIAELAAEARRVRVQLLDNLRGRELGEPRPARGEHLAGEITGLPDILGERRAFRALRDALDALPRFIREKLWAVLQVGRGPLGRRDWDATLAAAAGLSDAEIVAQMLDEADLHDLLRKGLFVLGAARVGATRPDRAPCAKTRRGDMAVKIRTAASAEEIRRMAGDLDDAVIADIQRTGATAAEVLEAVQWLRGAGGLEDEAGHVAHGAVHQVYEILQAEEPPEA